MQWEKSCCGQYSAKMLIPATTIVCAALAWVGPPQQEPAVSQGGSLFVEGVPEVAPFTVAASATDRILRLDLDIERGWHMYSAEVGGGAPISIVVGGAFENAGEVVFPPDPKSYVTGRAEILVPIRAVEGGNDEARSLTATVALQVCDALECLEPMTVELRGEVRALSTLLVVSEDDDHAARIQAWLQGRGFEVRATTYGDVDASMAEASDVVIADSKTFRSARSALTHLEHFPRTETPVFAVGFIGTELVEEHDLAMTSGYI